MENKENKKFTDPRWWEPLKPRVLHKSDVTQKQFEQIHAFLIKGLKDGTVKQEVYDEFMNN